MPVAWRAVAPRVASVFTNAERGLLVLWDLDSDPLYAPLLHRYQVRLTRCGDARRLSVMKNTFVAISSAGPNRDLSKGTRGQPFWDEHAAFIDQLVDDGFILMGGPFVDEGGSLLILNAEDENEVREKLKNDPWAAHGILKLESVKRWQIFIDARK